MDTTNYSWAEALVFQLNLIVTLDAATLLELVVESLDLDGGQLLQPDASDAGDKMVVDVILVV